MVSIRQAKAALFFLALIITASLVHASDPAPLHGLTLWGTLKYPADFKHFDYVNPNAPKGGEVKLAVIGTFDSLNPFIVKGNRAPGLNYLFESLMVGSLDEPQSMYGLIAKEAVVSADHSSIDFILRPEARFQDGTPITAQDVVFSLEQFKTKADPSYRISFEPVSSAEALAPDHVRFHFKDATRRELPIIVAGMPILSKAYYTTHDFTQTTLEPPLGSGPYKITSVDQGHSIAYTRIKNYWGEKLPVNIGQNNFDTIHFDIYRDDTVALEALKAGEYDMRQESIARAWATSYDCPALKDGRLKKTLIPNEVPQGMQGFIFNMRRAPFDDRRVREAIALTLDFEWMNKTLFFSAYQRDTSFFNNTPFAAKGLPDKEETALLAPYKDQLPPGIFLKPFELPVTDGSGDNRKELLRADALLKEAGWIVKDGVRVNAKTGKPLTIEFLLHQQAFERVVAPMRKHLKTLGIDASIRVVDEAQYQKRQDTHDYDIISMWYNQWVFFPGVEQQGYWHSSQADQEGSQNLAGTKNPVLDMLLAKMASAKNLDELTPAARAFDRVLLNEYYVVPQWKLSAYRVAYWDKFAMPNVAPKYNLGFQTWWLKNP